MIRLRQPRVPSRRSGNGRDRGMTNGKAPAIVDAEQLILYAPARQRLAADGNGIKHLPA